MKNKKKTYLLLAIVLIIWGILIYNIFSFTGKQNSVELSDRSISAKPLKIAPRNKLIIDVNYRDPFLGKMYMPQNNTLRSGKVKIKKKEPPVVWPEVIYKGLITDTKARKKVFMVAIAGKTYLMKEKDTEQEITLKKGNRESIDITFKGENYNVLIQQ